jgi:hypothetical protein
MTLIHNIVENNKITLATIISSKEQLKSPMNIYKFKKFPGPY